MTSLDRVIQRVLLATCAVVALGAAPPPGPAAPSSSRHQNGAASEQPAAEPEARAAAPQTDAPAPEYPPELPIDAIERGAKGYGLSVFSGTDPVRFEVEILGVVKNLHPDTSFILARLSGQGLDKSGVIAGMSGSPVFVGDRLAGAVSFSWSFANEAIAGITPIGPMRDLTKLPAAPPIRGVAAASVPTLKQLVSGVMPESVLDERLQSLVPQMVSGAASSLQWTSAGFGDRTRGLLERVLGPVAPSGSSPGLETKLVPGSAVAGVLVGGDLQLAVTGTVTERRGEDILAFGHSYLGLGPIDLPMAPAEIITVVPSRASSFKLANIGPAVGAFSEDRLVGILGRVGRKARTIPVDIRVATTPAGPAAAATGAQAGAAATAATEGTREFHLEIAEIPLTTPTLAAMGVLEAMDVARHQSGNQDLAISADLKLAGYDPLHLERHFTGPSAVINSAIYVLSVVSFVLNNESEEVKIDGLTVDVTQSAEPLTVSLIDAHPAERSVRPGDEVPLRLELRRYRGETFHRNVSVKLPDDLPAGPYYLFIGDGGTIDGARLTMEPTEPEDFRESLSLLRSLHHPTDLVVLGVLPSPGLVVEGRTLPRLPGSVRSIWSASGPLSAKPVGLAVRAVDAQSLDFPLAGGARVDLQILPPRS